MSFLLYFKEHPLIVVFVGLNCYAYGECAKGRVPLIPLQIMNPPPFWWGFLFLIADNIYLHDISYSNICNNG